MLMDLPGYHLDEPLPAGADAARHVPVSGGPARVWSGRRDFDGLPVALKILHRHDADRANREAVLTGAVDHPHVLPVLEVISGVDAVALVTPLARGGSLADLIAARRRLRWPEVLTVLIPLADALAAAHERDIVHGDLSAGNVLFDQDGRPLLADLGAARAAGELSGPVAATPTDVAPEIARGADPSPSTDLFSLGSVALHCLSGAPAWPADDLQDVLIESTAGQWPDPGDLLGPPDLVAIVRRLLDAEPSRRGSAARAAVELRRVGAPESVELVVQLPGGAVSAPPPATVVRPDATRPPGAQGVPRRVSPSWRSRWRRGRRAIGRGGAAGAGAAPSGRHHRPHRRHPAIGAVRPVGRRRWPGVVAAAVVLLLGMGAVRVGLWWAGQSYSAPTSVAALDVPPTQGPASADPPGPAGGTPSPSAAVAPSPPAAVAPSPSAAGTAALPTATGEVYESDADWFAVIGALDAARAAAFTARDPALLDKVYTASAPARAADAAQIATMVGAGFRVTEAEHRLGGAVLVGFGADGLVTVRVTETLPSYPVLDDAGSVVGATPAGSETVVLLGLVPSDDGFRISTLARG